MGNVSAWKNENSGRNWCSMMSACRSLPPVAAISTGWSMSEYWPTKSNTCLKGPVKLAR